MSCPDCAHARQEAEALADQALEAALRLHAEQWKERGRQEERALWTCILHGQNLIWCAECVEVERKANPR
jgi:hypothetical protein